MKTIKWLLGLEQGKLIVALLMIGISALFVQNQSKENQKDGLNSAFRDELMRREDSCEAQKERLIQSRRMFQLMLDSLLERSREVEAEVDSTIKRNRRVIDSTKSEVSNTKKLLRYDINARY